jgi:hypothetical protein
VSRIRRTMKIGHFPITALAVVAACAFAASVDRADAQAQAKPKPQIQVLVTVVNNSAVKAKGVFQSTDAGDLGTNCTVNANPTGQPNIGCTSNAKTYTNPPKNIKNLLCLQQKVGVQPTQACAALMATTSSPPGCKKNNIFTSLCGAGYAVNVVPSCIYRTNDSQAAPVSWTWTLSLIPGNSNQISVDCAISGYSGPTTN